MNTDHIPSPAARPLGRSINRRFADAHHPAGYRRSIPVAALTGPCPPAGAARSSLVAQVMGRLERALRGAGR